MANGTKRLEHTTYPTNVKHYSYPVQTVNHKYIEDNGFEPVVPADRVEWTNPSRRRNSAHNTVYRDHFQLTIGTSVFVIADDIP